MTVHKEGVIVRANVAESDMLRTSKNDLIDRGLSNYIYPEDHGTYFALILEVTKGEETEHRCQVRLLRTKIVPFYAQVRVEPAWRCGVRASALDRLVRSLNLFLSFHEEWREGTGPVIARQPVSTRC